MDDGKRKTPRDRREQLLTLVNGWDPLGHIAAGGPRNEYERVTDQVFGALSHGASREEVTKMLEGEFGPKRPGTAQFVTRVFTWYELDEE